jgi:opacity protein-like surface antigen
MNSARSAALAAAFLLLSTAPAAADVTGFLGANMTPENRKTQGFSVGAGLLLLGFEFEYANTPDDLESLSPSLKSYMGNVLLQTPFAILGLQPYLTSGGGVYRETLGETAKTGFALNNGAGVKINLIGPVRLRVDYRIFKLGSGALHSPAHRVYAGLNLKF